MWAMAGPLGLLTALAGHNRCLAGTTGRNEVSGLSNRPSGREDGAQEEGLQASILTARC